MPPFTYTPYRNEFVQPISALMQAPGQIEAQKAMMIGNAQAHAAQQSGTAWAGAANQIGQIPQELQQQKMQDLQMQDLKAQIAERNAQAQDRQRSLVAQAAGENAIKSAIGADGKVDYEKAAALWEQAGFPTQANAYRESVQKTRQTAQQLDEGQQKIEAGKRQMQQGYTDHLAELGASGLENLKHDNPLHARDYAMGLVANAASHGLISPDDAKQMLMQTAQAGPQDLAGIYQKLVDASPSVKARMVSDALKRAQTEKDLAEADKARNGKELVPKSLQSENEWQVDGKSQPVIFNPATGARYLSEADVAANKPIDPKRLTKIPAANSAVPALSDIALDESARVYNQTRQLPPGFGAAGIARQTAIMNRAAQLDPTAALAANQATYKADSATLTNLQKTEGTLSAFENTAGKNLDQFLSIASKVPDTGSPWVNQPLRTVNAKGLGNADQAAFNAARDVALREIARVTNDPKLSGALTDTARKEVLGLIPADATFAQIKRVAAVLKQDMANVHAGMTEQIGTVKARLGANPNGGGTQDMRPVRKYNPATGKIE